MSGDPALPTIAALTRPSRDGSCYLLPHHVESAARIRRLFEQSQLWSRITMHYGPRVGGGKNAGSSTDIADFAADARKRLNTLLGQIPSECREVILDVCCYERGLQEIEAGRGWPRRSAKLILRIGLEEGARILGLTSHAIGPEHTTGTAWMQPDARPTEPG